MLTQFIVSPHIWRWPVVAFYPWSTIRSPPRLKTLCLFPLSLCAPALREPASGCQPLLDSFILSSSAPIPFLTLPPLNLRTSTLSSFHGGSPFLTNWTLGRNFRSNGQHQCNKSSHPVTTGHFLKPRVILKIWILCWLPSLLPIIQANSCGFLYHWWNISIVRMSSEWPLIPAFLKWTLIEARNKWIHQRVWSVLVDCPTRWSLWYGYLDFYVDHLYFHTQIDMYFFEFWAIQLRITGRSQGNTESRKII